MLPPMEELNFKARVLGWKRAEMSEDNEVLSLVELEEELAQKKPAIRNFNKNFQLNQSVILRQSNCWKKN